ncbi:MAG: hypothetical protein ACFB0C_14385 [Leptolyngbyaceae cyanobacterium]
MTALILCPGVHDPGWTAGLMACLRQGDLWPSGKMHRFFPPGQRAWSAYALRRWLEATVEGGTPLVFLGFSAGCVAAISTAWACHHQGTYPVQAVIALDGWGVPLGGPFATYRLSHDRYTHLTGGLLGQGDRAFYGEPAVPHAQLWQAPEQVWGWSTRDQPEYITAAQFLAQCLATHALQ